MQVSTTDNPNPNDLYLQKNQQQVVNINKCNISTIKPKKHACTFCNKSFSTKYILSYHILIHLNPTNYSCDICNENFNTQNKLRKHKKTHKNIDYICDFCKASFFNYNNLMRHYKTEKHKNKLKGITDTKHSCTICIQSFNTKTRLQDHYSTDHKSAKPYVCEVCNHNYASEKILKIHLKKTHEASTSKPIKYYKCNLCYQPPFLHSKGLITHYKKQHPGKHPFTCDFCDKTFLHLTSKRQHSRYNHNDESLLKTSNQKTVSNNKNQDTYQDNNQDRLFELIDDIMPDIEQGSSANDTIFDIEQELNDMEQYLNERMKQDFNERIRQEINEIIKQDLNDMEQYLNKKMEQNPNETDIEPSFNPSYNELASYYLN